MEEEELEKVGSEEEEGKEVRFEEGGFDLSWHVSAPLDILALHWIC